MYHLCVHDLFILRTKLILLKVICVVYELSRSYKAINAYHLSNDVPSPLYFSSSCLLHLDLHNHLSRFFKFEMNMAQIKRHIFRIIPGTFTPYKTRQISQTRLHRGLTELTDNDSVNHIHHFLQRLRMRSESWTFYKFPLNTANFFSYIREIYLFICFKSLKK